MRCALCALQELRRHNSKCPVCRAHVEQMLHISHLDKSRAAPAGASGGPAVVASGGSAAANSRRDLA